MAEPEIHGSQSAPVLSVDVDGVASSDGSSRRIARDGLLPYGPVEMRVPSDPLSSRVVRLAASGVASLGGFTVDEIEDINMAVSEVLIALIEHGVGEVVDVQFAVGGQSFTIRGRTVNPVFDVDDPDLILCRTVLAGVCSEHGIEHVDDHAQIWAVVDHVAT
jgi:hypothetical protein